MKATDFALLVALGSIWGMSFIFIRVASPVIGPVPLMALRYSIGGAVTAIYLASRGGLRANAGIWREQWREFLLLGIFLMALPTVLIGYAELYISAALASVLNASTPFFAAAALYLWFGERLSGRQIAGLLVGFAGVAVAVGGVSQNLGLAIVGFAALSVAASACYGFSTAYVRKAKLRARGIGQGAGAQVFAAFVLLPFLPVTVRTAAPLSGPVLLAALLLALLSTALAYIVYFYLIEAIGGAQASTVTFISPIAGIIGGAVLLGEQIGPGLLAGLALIFLGIFLSSRTNPFAFLRRQPSSA